MLIVVKNRDIFLVVTPQHAMWVYNTLSLLSFTQKDIVLGNASYILDFYVLNLHYLYHFYSIHFLFSFLGHKKLLTTQVFLETFLAVFVIGRVRACICRIYACVRTCVYACVCHQIFTVQHEICVCVS